MKIPSIGLGGKIVQEKNSDLERKQYEIYKYALTQSKCELFDTSPAYGLNEKILGDSISEYGIRENVYIISKVTNSQQREGDIKRALDSSLDALKTDYLDAYLIHWPQAGTFLDTWKQLELLYEEGIVKQIGVCNFQKHHFEELKLVANIQPMFNEIEIHPLFTQETLLNYCYANCIDVIAYTPLGRMHDVLVKSKPIISLAEKYQKNVSQIILRWHYQQKRIAIPSTLNVDHLECMNEIYDFELTDREIAWISSVNDNVRLRYNSDSCDFTRL